MTKAFLLTVVAILGAAASRAAAPPDPRIEAIIDRMTPRQRVAQLLFVGFSGTRMNDEIRRLVVDWRVGAIAIYSRNVSSAPQLRALTTEIRELPGGEVMPLLAVDQEGGEVTRIADGVPQLPGQMALGATRSDALARRAGRALGASLSRLGITLNLAPVVDVAEADSPLGIRAFSANAELTGSLSAAFIGGESDGGVASTAKHFPGIGTVRADSHDELPVLAATHGELQHVQFAPFRAAISAGVEAVMVGHVSVPAIDGVTPATLSPRILGLLRNELHFDGIVITDALEMHALDRHEGIGRLAVRSVAAGADLVLVLWHDRDREEALDALDAAYRTGELSEERVRQSLRRILRLKIRTRARGNTLPDDAVADEIASRAVTLLRNNADLLPLRGKAERVYIGPPGPIAEVVHASRAVYLPTYIAPEGVATWASRASEAIGAASVIVGVAQNRAQIAAIGAAHEARPSARVILVSLGSPQLLSELPDAAVYLCTYGYLAPSQRAVAAVLAGHAVAIGHLPVDVPGHFHDGDGIIRQRGDH